MKQNTILSYLYAKNFRNASLAIICFNISQLFMFLYAYFLFRFEVSAITLLLIVSSLKFYLGIYIIPYISLKT